MEFTPVITFTNQYEDYFIKNFIAVFISIGHNQIKLGTILRERLDDAETLPFVIGRYIDDYAIKN